MTDVIIPLGNGSCCCNNELKLLLRSIDRNLLDVGTVYIVSLCPPAWLQNVVIVPVADKYTDNKDANLDLKTLTAIAKHNIGQFVWCADDNVFMQPVNGSDIPVIHNHRPLSYWEEAQTKWQRRMKNTLDFAKSRGIELQHGYECHCPQVFDGQKLLEGMKDVDYVKQPGLTIYTAWRVVTDTWRDSKDQRDYKWTFEQAIDTALQTMSDEQLCSKMFAGYNNNGVQAGCLDRLIEIFKERSRYEK